MDLAEQTQCTLLCAAAPTSPLRATHLATGSMQGTEKDDTMRAAHPVVRAHPVTANHPDPPSTVPARDDAVATACTNMLTSSWQRLRLPTPSRRRRRRQVFQTPPAHTCMVAVTVGSAQCAERAHGSIVVPAR